MVRTGIARNSAIAAALVLLFCAEAGAETPERQQGAMSTPPFKLGVEKRHFASPEDPQSQGASLRISRDKLQLNAQTPMVAPPIKQNSVTPLNASDFALRAQQANLDGAAESSAPLKGNASFGKILANYDIELIVDESMSMRKRDCPGRLSRWEWCGTELGDLSRQLAPYAPRGFTLTTFASLFDTYENSNPREVQELFANPQFNLGTRLSGPLNARLNNYFARRSSGSRPLLIVVITDGVPHPRMEPDRVAQALINASHRVRRPNEVTVVFFQIGGADRFGRYFLDQMDNALVANGASCDIVRTVFFEQLYQQGLTRSLVASIRHFAQQQAAR